MSCIVTIQYNAPSEFGKDKMEIKIENTTFGALQVLNHNLKKLSIVVDTDNSYTQNAYLDLIEQFTQELEKVLNSDI